MRLLLGLLLSLVPLSAEAATSNVLGGLVTPIANGGTGMSTVGAEGTVLQSNGTSLVYGSSSAGITAITGDISASGTGSVVATLPDVNSNVGTFNNLQVNAKGQVTAGSNTSYLTNNQSITLSSDCTGSGTTAISVTCTKTNGSSFGTMATQNANNVAITGGNLIVTTATATTFNGNLAGNASTVTTNANLTGVITSVGNATSWGTTPCIPTEIDGHANASPTAASLKCGASIYNYGQAASNVNITLPTAVANLSFVGEVGTAQAASYWRFTSATAGTMYLDGSTTGKNYVQFSAPAVGNYLWCRTFKSGSSTYSWTCRTGSGFVSTN